jgi:membrane fusion protein, multidrug efflux system
MKSKLFPLLFCALYIAGCQKPAPPPPAAHMVTVTQATVKDVPLYREYVGHVVAKINVQVMSQASGIITQQRFIEGQEVKKGDLLLVIDPRPYQASLQKAEAQLAQTYASLKYNQEKTMRYASLVQKDFVSQLDYDQYVTNVLTDEAQVQQNQAEIEQAKINLGYCYIMAPMDCVTGKLQVKAGNYVDAMANTVLTTLTQIQPILIDFFAPETDLLLIQEQQRKGNLALYAYPDPEHKCSFKGDLTLIDNQVNTGTGSILLEGTFANEQKILWPGHFVDVKLILGEQKNALLLPTQAVMVGQSGYYVFVVKSNSTIEMRPVTVGQKYDQMTAVLSGITASDKVVTQGQLNLYQGMKVEIKE